MLPEQRSYATSAQNPQNPLPATSASSLDGATGMTVGVYWKGLDGNRWIKDASGTRNLGSYTTGADTYWNNNGYMAINDPINV